MVREDYLEVAERKDRIIILWLLTKKPKEMENVLKELVVMILTLKVKKDNS